MGYKISISKPLIEDEEKKAVIEVLSSGNLAQGEKVRKFEEDFAKYLGVKRCVAVNSGTAALHLALMALDIRNNDEVITTPFSFVASSNCILYCNAKPVFADINPRTLNIDPKRIEEKITDKTKAILAVHLYGQPAEMAEIKEIADGHNLLLIEDAAQAHGAKYENDMAGSIGDIGCFSFYPTKNMTTKEGGMIATNDEEVAEKLELLRNHGQAKQYYHSILGFNFRMTDVAAAIGIEQLKKLERFNEIRIRNAEFLTKSISDVKWAIPLFIHPNVKHVFNQYTIRVKDGKISRDLLQQRLDEFGIQTKVYYPLPIHKQILYQNLGYKDVLPEAESASNEVLSLPVHPSLSKDNLEFIVESMKSLDLK